jgi:NADP-dependent 3-hydroxy acid dehydrogenase YdfG
LVTGATGGIGGATVARLLTDGFRVAAAGTRSDRVAELCANDQRLHGVVADIRRVSECERAVAEAVQWGGRLDLLVNNAGIWEGGRSDQVSEVTWDQILAVNLKGAFFLCR